MPDFRLIPSIDELRHRPGVDALATEYGAAAVVDALRAAAAATRAAISAGRAAPESSEAAADGIEALARSTLRETIRPSLAAVINATGVVVHTNLGRAPLARTALERIAEVGRGYASLEYDLHRGGRGRRDVHAEALLCRLTGAEAAVVVNNNAAATLIVLAALASGREVIVSRGELVEIGGGFRVPDVMAQSGATLREVGTTNKTRAADYAAAINDRTALVLRVHPSNFRVEGFTERPRLEELVALGRRFDVRVAEDLGSGHLAAWSGRVPGGDDSVPSALRDEPAVIDSIAAGVDLCCFSGDKLLGGPQAGIIVGRRGLVDAVRRHPLMRALRVDKLTYAALEATLVEYATGRAAATIPVQRMITTTAGELRERADAIAGAIARGTGWRAGVVAGASTIGGGSAPGSELPTWLVAIAHDRFSAASLDARLRALDPPIVARIERDAVVIDVRTVLPEQDAALAAAIQSL